MLYHDRLYGNVHITNPLVLDLINSQPMQRLKGVDQAGYFDVYVPGTKHSRFEHSLGVYLLLQKYKAPFEEQIAGLIHDVSHSAFSHCIDYVFGAKQQKTHHHQDGVFTDFVKHSSLPLILKKYHIDTSYILDDHNFPLKEMELPDLCADRIDYSLRTAVVFGVIDVKQVQYFLSHLHTHHTRWVFDTADAAEKYANLFRTLNTIYYSGFPSATMFYTVGQYVKYALRKKYTDWKTLYTTDDIVIKQINRHLESDTHLQTLWERMNNKIPAINDPKKYESIVYVKSRLVDPLFEDGKIIHHLSKKNVLWKQIIKTESRPKKYFLRFTDKDQ